MASSNEPAESTRPSSMEETTTTRPSEDAMPSSSGSKCSTSRSGSSNQSPSPITSATVTWLCHNEPTAADLARTVRQLMMGSILRMLVFPSWDSHWEVRALRGPCRVVLTLWAAPHSDRPVLPRD